MFAYIYKKLMLNKLKPNVIIKLNLWNILNKKHNVLINTKIYFLSQLNSQYKNINLGLLNNKNITIFLYIMTFVVLAIPFILFF